MEGQQELTPKSALIILNSHIDNVIKGTCGKGGDEPSWGLMEINSIINCIGTIKVGLDQGADAMEKLEKVRAEQNKATSKKK